MLWLSVVAFVVSLLASGAIVRWSRVHPSAYGEAMPQRFHAGSVPRIGGIALYLGLCAGCMVGLWRVGRGDPVHLDWGIWVSLWLVALLPAVIGGIAEDFTQRLTVRYRLLLTLATAILACWWLDLGLTTLGLPWLDGWMPHAPWIGIGVALLAIAGLPHAFNIIDGYNGLAAMVAVVVCLALVHVALQVDDRALAAILLCMVAATIGFFIWNYPLGLIFAGDSGAYVWGAVIAIASLLLVTRHTEVSPWFPMLLLIYPVWETMFSIYRKVRRGDSPGMADALHFHQLVYRRIVGRVFHENLAQQMLKRNNRTSPYLWGFTLLTVVPAVLFWRHTWVLVFFCALFCLSYVLAYLALVRFKVPRVFRRSDFDR